MKPMAHNAFRDVLLYPNSLLAIQPAGVSFPVTYKKSWDDGFGARGWKLDATIGDPQIIASTRETGERINTSVFVHDILDHFLSGFGVSGHRSEAMALIQLSKRTQSDPSPDYGQMVREDIMRGSVNGESLATFLPEQLVSMLPADANMNDKEAMSFLMHTIGEQRLCEMLVARFFDLGRTGEQHATDSWSALGLNPQDRTAMGLSLQELLESIDREAEEVGVDKLEGRITLSHKDATFYPSQ